MLGPDPGIEPKRVTFAQEFAGLDVSGKPSHVDRQWMGEVS
jgi:hypothetical protein